jgi:TRAP-type C4-dicarboxylate transport system permease small subunit
MSAAALSTWRTMGGGLFRLLDCSLRPVEAAAAVVGGLMMLLAMVLMTLDAIMRYLFTSPIEIAPRLIEFYLMVGMFAMPLAWGFRTGGYIRIVAAVASLPARVRNFIMRAGLLTSSVYVAGLAWASGVHFLETWRSKEVYVGVIDWSIAWSWIWVPVGLGLLAARLVLMSFGAAEDLTVTHSEGN